jgi:hypothetical protein
MLPPIPTAVELTRKANPELTRCVVCDVLDSETRMVSVDGACVWLHRYCESEVRITQSAIVRRQGLRRDVAGFVRMIDERVWEAYSLHSLRMTFVGEFASAQDAEAYLIRAHGRQKPSHRWERRPRVKRSTKQYCYCCQHYETPEHKFNRLGYEPIGGWAKPDVAKSNTTGLKDALGGEPVQNFAHDR